MSAQPVTTSDLSLTLPSEEKMGIDWITALVIALLGASVLAGGAYLIFSGIGMIPSVISGSTLIIAGGAAIIWAIFSVSCHPKPRQAVSNLNFSPSDL